MKATFPYFESGLPLRSRDLNAIYARADEDVRNSRTCLHGMGIFYGLHTRFEPIESQIIIEAGAGITSQGYLFCPDDKVTLLKISKTKIKVDVKRFSTDPFTMYLEEKETGTTTPTTIDVEELYVKDEVPKEIKDNVRNLSSTDLIEKIVENGVTTNKNKLLVIFFQVNKTKAEGCATCDKGILADLEVKYLLVNEKAFSDMTFVCTIEQSNTNVAFEPIKPPLSLSRIGLGDNCIAINAWQPTSYDVINDTAIENISTEIKRAIGVFGDVFSNTEGVAGLARLDILKGSKINGQYIHDYLRLVIRAYNEFVSAPFAKHFAALPPATCFPKHLVLGHFDEKPANGTAASFVFDETATHTINEKTARTKLYRPPYDDATEVDFAHAKRLYARLMSLLNNHKLDKELERFLRITPSRRPSHPLSMQAIPFYLNAAEVRKTWRLEALYTETIPHYGTPIPLTKQPAFDEADFYRIEGHIGLSLVENGQRVKNRIEIERDCQNLPFQVIVTGLSLSPNENGWIFSQFALSNYGLEHQGGVPAGGTFVLVVNEQNMVIADFCLPYWVQPKVVDVLANMTVTSNGKNSFTFNAAKSLPSNATVLWFVDDVASPVTGSEISGTRGEVFTRIFAIPTSEDVRNYFVKLEVTADGRKDVEMVTVVVAKQIKRPVAQFEVSPTRKDIHSEDFKTGETITFINKSSEQADSFEWFVDGETFADSPTDRANFEHNFRFVLTDSTKEAQDFVVTLKAYDKTKAEFDIEEITVTIRRSTAQQVDSPKPNATLRLRKESFISPSGEFSDKHDIITCTVDSFGEDGLVSVTAVFDILPTLNQDDRYRIVIIEKVKNLLTNKELETVIEELETSSLTPIVRLDKFQWNVDEFKLNKFYIIRLFSWRHDFPQIEDQKDKNLVLILKPQIVEEERGLMAAFETIPVVEQAAALKELRTRQRDYRTALEQTAVAESKDKTDETIYAALTFISGFQHDATKLEEQMSRWQQVIESALPSKKTAKVTVSQQAIVQNLVLFLFDKLTDLQATGISDQVMGHVKTVFDILKTYKNININALKEVWQVESIRTAENSATVGVLLSLF